MSDQSTRNRTSLALLLCRLLQSLGILGLDILFSLFIIAITQAERVVVIRLWMWCDGCQRLPLLARSLCLRVGWLIRRRGITV